MVLIRRDQLLVQGKQLLILGQGYWNGANIADTS